MRLIDADKFKCILPCNKEFHHIINHARTVKAIPCKNIEKMRAEILEERRKNTNMEYDKIFELCILIIEKYIDESEDTSYDLSDGIIAEKEK